MWDVVLPAAIGAASSLTVWGLKAAFDARSRRIDSRADWAAQVLDYRVHREVENISSSEDSWSTRFDLLARIPQPSGRANIATKGQLARAHHAVRKQVSLLIDMRLAEIERGEYFSMALDPHVSSFETRLIRWSNGRGSAVGIFRRVPNV